MILITCTISTFGRNRSSITNSSNIVIIRCQANRRNQKNLDPGKDRQHVLVPHRGKGNLDLDPDEFRYQENDLDRDLKRDQDQDHDLNQDQGPNLDRHRW